MARKGKGSGLKGLGPNYPAEFLSPLNAPRVGAEPGPDVANAPLFSANDPLGFIPGGTSKPGRKGR